MEVATEYSKRWLLTTGVCWWCKSGETLVADEEEIGSRNFIGDSK